MKHIHDISLFEKNGNIYYNHWKKTFKFSELMDKFVDGPESIFSREEVDDAKDLYGIDDDSIVAWVSSEPRPDDNKGLSVDSYNRSNDVPDTELCDILVDVSDGVVIPELNDGKNSYLFLIGKPTHI